MAAHPALDAWQETHGASSAARWEFERVIEECAGEPIEVVLEVGAHTGASLAVWIEEFQPERAVGIELEYSERTLRGLLALDRERTTILFGNSTNTQMFNVVMAMLGGRPIDFLYIDGDHEGLAPSIDLALYGTLVRPGGVIVMDDTKREPGVQHVVRSLPDGLLIEGPGDSTGKYLLRKPEG